MLTQHHFVPPAPAASVWPSTAQVLGGSYGRWRNRLKYHGRLLVTGGLRQQFLADLARYPAWLALFAAHPAYFHVPLRRYLDRRWSARQRFAVCTADLATAHSVFGNERVSQLATRAPARLYTSADFALELACNPVMPYEGLWSLALLDAQGEVAYQLSFGFTDRHGLLIGSIQGRREGKDCIQTLTKQLHGLRPPFLLLYALQCLAQAWGLNRLSGIDLAHQVKRNPKHHTRQGFQFDYAAFWQEAGAQLNPHGHWALPLSTPRRSPEDIPTRKRSQYRKRYALLDALASALHPGQTTPQA
jgi:uncharacterized protein VirK/YbjX